MPKVRLPELIEPYRESKRIEWRPGRILAGIVLLMAVGLTVYTWWDNQRIVIRSYEVRHPQVPPAFDGFRIVFVSDLEGRVFGPHQQRLVQEVVSQRPDLVLLGGDYVDKRRPTIDPVTDLIRGLRQQLDVSIYFVMGDKDYFIGDPPAPMDKLIVTLEGWEAQHLDAPVRVLRGGDAIWLAPFNTVYVVDPSALEAALAKEAYRLSQAEQEAIRQGTAFRHGVRPEDFVIVLDHKPLRNFGQYLRDVESLSPPGPPDTITSTYTDHDLMLAGHTHGGQIRLPLIGPLVEPSGRLFPGDDYVKGIFQDEDGRYQVVGAGLGASGPWCARFRFLNPPEVVVVILRREEQ